VLLARRRRQPSLTPSEIRREVARPPSKALPEARSFCLSVDQRTNRPRPSHPGRAPLPASLERREEIVPCCPEDCHCPKRGIELPVIGCETREELAFRAAEFWVRVLKREKRGSHCEEEQGVVRTPIPAQIVPKGKLSNEFILEALVRKCRERLPVYRQCATLAQDHRIELSRKTLTDAILAAGSLLIPVVRAMRTELLAGASGTSPWPTAWYKIRFGTSIHAAALLFSVTLLGCRRSSQPAKQG